MRINEQTDGWVGSGKAALNMPQLQRRFVTHTIGRHRGRVGMRRACNLDLNNCYWGLVFFRTGFLIFSCKAAQLLTDSGAIDGP